MAFQTGTATDIVDLMTKLDAFATGLVTTPWTRHNTNLTYGYFTLSRGDCYVTFRWQNSSDTNLAMYQSLGFTLDTTLPQDQPDDSGNGSTVSPAIAGRRVNLTDGVAAYAGPFTSYTFFASEGSTPTVYVVLETVSGVFRHFCFGNAVKNNDWIGGGFVFGHYWNPAASYIDNPSSSNHAFLADGLTYQDSIAGTMHIEGMPLQLAAEKWGVFCSTSSIGTDTGGNNRIELFGSSRSGLWTRNMSWMRASELNAYKPLLPISILHRQSGISPNALYWLGSLPDVAIVNLAYFSPGDAVVIGSDTWYVYPWARAQHQLVNTEESWNAGVAYKRG